MWEFLESFHFMAVCRFWISEADSSGSLHAVNWFTVNAGDALGPECDWRSSLKNRDEMENTLNLSIEKGAKISSVLFGLERKGLSPVKLFVHF